MRSDPASSHALAPSAQPYAFAACGLALTITLVFLIVSHGVGRAPQDYLDLMGLVPAKPLDVRKACTFLTYGFMHFEIGHLLSNLLGVALLAHLLRRDLSPKLIVVLFLAGIVAAGAAHVVVFTASTVPLMGASGGVAALAGAILIFKLPGRVLKAIIGLVAAGSLVAMSYHAVAGGLSAPMAGDTCHIAHAAGLVFGSLAVCRPSLKHGRGSKT